MANGTRRRTVWSGFLSHARERRHLCVRMEAPGMEKIKQAASAFLASKRVAGTGLFREPKDHGSNVVYKRLRERGYEVFAINPNADQVEGDRCYHDLSSVPDGVDA